MGVSTYLRHNLKGLRWNRKKFKHSGLCRDLEDEKQYMARKWWVMKLPKPSASGVALSVEAKERCARSKWDAAM